MQIVGRLELAFFFKMWAKPDMSRGNVGLRFAQADLRVWRFVERA